MTKPKTRVAAPPPLITADELEIFRAQLPAYRQHEAFKFLNWNYDVIKALALIDRGYAKGYMVPVAHLRLMLDLCYVNDDYVLSEACAQDDRPLVFVLHRGSTGDRFPLLIDGLHRAARATIDQREQMRMWLLDDASSDECLLR